MMRKVFAALLLVVSAVTASAQNTQQEYLDRYNLLSNRLGATGVGIETLLDKWEAAYPDDENMLAASFLFYYEKCQERVTVSKDAATYLGQKPLLQLKDSLGNNVNYFYDTNYDDELFVKAQQYIDRMIQARPDNLDNRFAAITALMNYEKESPDMALSKLKDLVDYNYSSRPEWNYDGETVDNERFKSLLQEYCYSFFRLGSASGYESFRALSEKMLQYNANDVLFMDNIGSYYLVGKDDPKTAQKYYNKVLKIKPDDLTAIQNCILLARKQKNVKLEKKYLAMLAQHAEDEPTKLSAQARLEHLGSGK